MDNKEYYTKLADYLILNGYSKEGSGLYYGKAGIAIGLFELSRFLQDERIEDHAFELLKQSLLTKAEFCDLEIGLSGIAYALRYLTKNHFIEADQNELFGEKLRKIAVYVEEDVHEWQEKMNRLYSLLYAFGNEELSLLKPSSREKAEILWLNITHDLLNDLLKVQNIDSPFTQEIHRRFLVWLQWTRRLQQRRIVFQIDTNLLYETTTIYQKIKELGLLIESYQVEYFLSPAKTPTILHKEVDKVKSIHERDIISFCTLSHISDKDMIKNLSIDEEKTEERLQRSFAGNNFCSSLQGGIIQFLMRDIAIQDRHACERLSELILLPNLHSMYKVVKTIESLNKQR